MSTIIDTLPVILVSAANESAATMIISELIDNDITEDYLKDQSPLWSPDRVWRLVNKYYSANVRVHSLTDNAKLNVDLDTIEAHIIYITKEELSEGESGAAARAARRAAAGAWRRAHVRLLLLDAAAPPPALAAWGAAARAHVVPLREPPAPAPARERWPDAAGAPRARQALHAHVWRGLQRTDRPARRAPAEDSSSSSCADTDDEEADELRAVEHAEAFAAALGALGPALGARDPVLGARDPVLGARDPVLGARDPVLDARDPVLSARDPTLGAGDQLGADPRHDRAEALVAAFCRALGYDLDAC